MSIFKFPNGYKNPRIEVYDGQTRLGVWNFPECTKDGFVETYELIEREKKDIEETLITRPKGIRTTLTLHYNDYITYATLMKLVEVWGFWVRKSQYEDLHIYLTPNLDILKRRLDVKFVSKPISLRIMRGGRFAKGGKLVIVQFKEIRISKDIPIGNPNSNINKLIFPFKLFEL